MSAPVTCCVSLLRTAKTTFSAISFNFICFASSLIVFVWLSKIVLSYSISIVTVSSVSTVGADPVWMCAAPSVIGRSVQYRSIKLSDAVSARRGSLMCSRMRAVCSSDRNRKWCPCCDWALRKWGARPKSFICKLIMKSTNKPTSNWFKLESK